jgi:hypothetical protein
MPRLDELAKVIRSKNAGPYQITFDLLFDDHERYVRAAQAPDLTPARVAARLGLAEQDVAVYHYPRARAVKITVPRAASAGSLEDGDLYGAQQHVWLYDIEVPWEMSRP